MEHPLSQGLDDMNALYRLIIARQKVESPKRVCSKQEQKEKIRGINQQIYS